MEIIGHRGAHGLAPENSLIAIKRGIQAKVDMIEVDVRVLNGELVLSHDPLVKSQKYALLEDALTVVDERVALNLEIKEFEAVKLLPQTVKGYNGKILFSSFEYNTLHEIHRLLPKYDLAILEKWSGVRAVAEASLLDTNRIHINQQWLWSGFVKSMKHRGFKLYAYTVNSRDRAEELELWGVDGIFTDYPNLFQK